MERLEAKQRRSSEPARLGSTEVRAAIPTPGRKEEKGKEFHTAWGVKGDSIHSKAHPGAY